MRLYELIQEDPFQVKDVRRETLPSFATSPVSKRHYMDHGHFSSVFGHPDNPHDVLKGTRRFTEEDGYEAFIRALANDEKMRDNIYMPRIRTARVVTSTKTDQRASMIRMERLEPLTNLSEREAHMLLVNLIGREAAIEKKNQYNKNNVFIKNDYKRGWREALSGILNSHSSGVPSDSIINDDWLEAYKWVRDIARDQGWNMDLHSENWMFRRTPFGPQLVITDPFSWKKLAPA